MQIDQMRIDPTKERAMWTLRYTWPGMSENVLVFTSEQMAREQHEILRNSPDGPGWIELICEPQS